MSDRKSSTRRTGIFLGERHTSVFNRFAAKSIDVIIVIAVFLLGQRLCPPLGIVLGALVGGFSDALGDGQSIGKRIIGLKVIEDFTGMSCGFGTSLVRNTPIPLAVLFASFELFWILLLVIILPVVILEMYLILSIDTGVRLGDVLANTLVTEQQEPVMEFPGEA
jgi:RDD family